MSGNDSDESGFRPEASAPKMWIIDSSIGRRRLLRRGGSLQVDQGIAGIVEPDVPSIAIGDIEDVQVLAPYDAPAPRLAIALGGVAAGLAMSGNATAQLFAIVVVAFAVVAAMVSAGTPSGQSLARFTTKGGTSHCFAFRNEDEHYVRTTLSSASWRNGRDLIARTMLDPEQAKQVDRVRTGIVLAASAIGLVVMMRLSTAPDDNGIASMASMVIRYATFGLVGIVNVVAWGKMIAAYASSRRANRPAPRA